MSIYIPKPGSLLAVEHKNWKGSTGTIWMIHDQHGEYDGPYETEYDAVMQIKNIRKIEEEGLT